STDPHLPASSFTLGSTTTSSTTNDFYISKPVISILRTSDTAATDYAQVTITANAGSELNLQSFSFDGARGGAATPRTYDVRSSVTGLQTTDPSLGSGAFATARGAAGATDTLPTFNFDLSGAAYQHLSTLTMRMYFFTPTTNQNIDLDNFVFNGTVAATPEPASLALLGLGGLAALGRRRR
ncbi:MAG: hypothetical protein JWM57_3420, partial [Phycisphaerales bacterium]|nr:hypothetical protein [Phycisphaerales bacterium]